MKVEIVSIESIVPYANNPRNNEEAIEKVARSIDEFGWQQPIVVDENMVIIVGHTRLLAAKSLGLNEVPIHVADKLTDEQARAYRLADNRTNEYASWDMKLVGIELRELDDLGMDIESTGFSNIELASLLIDPDFDVGTEDDQGKLDQLDPKYVVCPKCGNEFDIREQK